MSDANLIGNNIRSARKNKNWAQTDLARATGIANTVISAYERGKKAPGLETLAIIASALEVSLDQLYYGDENEAFINKATDVGTKVVNSIYMLWILGVIGHGNRLTRMVNENKMVFNTPYDATIKRLINALEEYASRKETFADPDVYLDQLKKSCAKEINNSLDLLSKIAPKNFG